LLFDQFENISCSSIFNNIMIFRTKNTNCSMDKSNHIRSALKYASLSGHLSIWHIKWYNHHIGYLLIITYSKFVNLFLCLVYVYKLLIIVGLLCILFWCTVHSVFSKHLWRFRFNQMLNIILCLNHIITIGIKIVFCDYNCIVVQSTYLSGYLCRYLHCYSHQVIKQKFVIMFL